MKTTYQTFLAFLCILLVSAAALCAGCASSGPAPAATPVATSSAPVATASAALQDTAMTGTVAPSPVAGGSSVTIENFAFSPETMTVKSGTTVTWTNRDTASHTIVSDTGAFSSDPVGNGGTYQFTFSQAGTYPYHCSIHPSMKGTIIVQP